MRLDEPTGKTIMGSVRLLAEDDEAYFSTGEWPDPGAPDPLVAEDDPVSRRSAAQ